VDSRIAVLASGSGTNLQALLDDREVGPCVRLVVSDVPGALALERARAREVRAVVLEPAHYGDRETHDLALEHLLEEEGIEFVLLAGYMRIVGPNVVRAFANRILNVHPALLPAFPGAHAVGDALAWGARVTGATVHLVDEQVDHGPVVLQEAVDVREVDDERSLHARIQEVEHRLFPRAVRLMAEGRLDVDGRQVRIRSEAPVTEGAR
jgi:phosphoribosylglycinamide formyltransferase-1